MCGAAVHATAEVDDALAAQFQWGVSVALTFAADLRSAAGGGSGAHLHPWELPWERRSG